MLSDLAATGGVATVVMVGAQAAKAGAQAAKSAGEEGDAAPLFAKLNEEADELWETVEHEDAAAALRRRRAGAGGA